MAEVFGQPGKEDGDRKVYNALKKLPSECIIYAQPKLVYKREVRYPDYVLVNKNWGVIVLEVKDWVKIQDIKSNGLEVYRTELKRWEHEDCPVDQAKGAAETLANMLKEDNDLRNYAGKLDFSYAYGVILPNLFGISINNCNYRWGVGHVLGLLDLTQDKITEKIANIPVPFRCLMTDAQVRAVCATIDEGNKVIDPDSGNFKGILDATQESIAKEELLERVIVPNVVTSTHPLLINMFPDPTASKEQAESELPEEVLELKADNNVRLVRGFPGTGKTDVLIRRAEYQYEQHPDKMILVTTFNDPLYQNRLVPELKHLKGHVDVIKFDSLCSSIYKKRHGQWREPQPIKGLLTHMGESDAQIKEWGVDFLADEFTWIKESGRTKRNDYISKPRAGRGKESKKTLSRNQKNILFDFFLKYEEELNELRAYDWADLHDKTFKYLEEGIRPEKYYDSILIDEAQHFAPVWVSIITQFLKPGGQLFMCDDPSQSVYRYFSWRQKGIDVVGKTRWLRVIYRNSRQIFEAAFSLIAHDSLALRLLGEDKTYTTPDLDSPTHRNGPKPLAIKFSSIIDEKQYILEKIIDLVAQGVRKKAICILHNQKYVLEDYKKLIDDPEITIANAISQTGMEYSAVFIPQVPKLFERSIGKSWEEDQSELRLSFYMMMTRARSYLYMTYQQKWPKELLEIKDFVDWEDLSE